MIRVAIVENPLTSSAVELASETLPRLGYAELVDRALQLAAVGENRTHEVSALARRLNVSSRTLERAFRSQQGTTVRDALAQLRIQAACRLLAETSDSVSTVATRAGYCSASKMCDVFRMRLKLTPRQYRVSMSQRQISC